MYLRPNERLLVFYIKKKGGSIYIQGYQFGVETGI